MFFLTERCTIEESIKKSRFIGVIAPCENEQMVLNELKALQTQHPHATHIAFAYRFKMQQGIVYRFHDSGEPTGTAGKPIFQHIEGKDIVNVLVAVIRYFGGVKLGAGGLTRAYGNTAKQVIDTASLQPYVEQKICHLTLDYDQFQLFEYTLKKVDGCILEQKFAEQIQVTIKISAEKMTSISTQFTFSFVY